MPIQFFFIETFISLKERKRLKLFLQDLFIANNKPLHSLVFIFCKDEYLLNINKQFLQHDFYTDIITFNLADAKNLIEGEIYISIDRIKENAKINNATLKQELHRIIFHGALHLCGFNDKTIKDKAKMTRLEDKCLSAYLV